MTLHLREIDSEGFNLDGHLSVSNTSELSAINISDNSFWLGDETLVSLFEGKIKLRKRNKSVVPPAILQAGQEQGHDSHQVTIDAALAHAGVATVNEMKLSQWHGYIQMLKDINAPSFNEVFSSYTDDDFEELGSELYCNNLYGALSGNADTATRLRAARKINGVDFDGSADIDIATGVDGITSVDGDIGIGTEDAPAKLYVLNSADSTGQGDAYIPGLTSNPDDRKPSECSRLQGKWRSPGSGALLRFTNKHSQGTNPNSGEYNLAGIAGFDYANEWGGGLCFYTSPGGSANAGGGDLTARMIIDSAGDVQVENRLKLSGTKALQQNRRFKYNISVSGNNNHTLQIPITGSTAQGVMFAKVSAVQVAANSSGADYRMVEGWLTAYNHTSGVALKATRAIDGQNFYVYHVTEAIKSTGTLYIQYRPSQGFNQNVSITFDVELVLGGTFSTAGVLSHHYESQNVGLALHSADTGRSCFNFRYNPPNWGYVSNHQTWDEDNLFSFTLNVPYDGWVYLKSHGHWAKMYGSYFLGGNDGFYAWVAMDNNDASAGSLVDHDYTPTHHASVYTQDRFHEYNPRDAGGAGNWRDFSHNNWYKVTAGNRQFSLRVAHGWGSLHMNGASIAGFYIPRTDI